MKNKKFIALAMAGLVAGISAPHAFAADAAAPADHACRLEWSRAGSRPFAGSVCVPRLFPLPWGTLPACH